MVVHVTPRSDVSHSSLPEPYCCPSPTMTTQYAGPVHATDSAAAQIGCEFTHPHMGLGGASMFSQ